jgi:hypothetical protein
MPGRRARPLRHVAAVILALALTSSACSAPTVPIAGIRDEALPTPAPAPRTAGGSAADIASGGTVGVPEDVSGQAAPGPVDVAGSEVAPPAAHVEGAATGDRIGVDGAPPSPPATEIDRPDQPGRTPTISAACTTPDVELLQPADGATVVAGHTLVAGRSAMLADRELMWTVQGPRGELVISGYVMADGSGAFAATAELAMGAVAVVVEPTAAGGAGLMHEAPCATLRSDVTVVLPGTWASGASGAGVADGRFADWRGSGVQIAGAWVDDIDAAASMWLLQPGREYANWGGDLDLAVGAIGPGETWAAAAQGAYDDRWRQSLQELESRWGGRSGTVFIRFAHEFNGDWYSWRVTSDTVADFRTAWQRYRALQQQYMPDGKLVFAPNSDTSASSGLDWRQAFPGSQYVDVMAVDYYNMYPWTDTIEDFQRTSLAFDQFGAPRGLQRHQEFAARKGLPFAVSEWGNNGSFGDSAVFIEQMRAFFVAHAGIGPGQLRYEVLFNAESLNQDPYQVFPVTETPRAAAAYERLF